MGYIIKEVPEKTTFTNHLLDRVSLDIRFPFVLELGTVNKGELVTAYHSELVTEIASIIKKDMPLYKTLISRNINIDLTSNSGPQFKTGIESPVHTFTSKDGKRVCEFTASSFKYTINDRSVYSGFNDFVENFWSVWTLLKDKMKLEVIERVGIRKINKIPLEKFDLQVINSKLKPCFIPSFTSIAMNVDPIDYVGREIVKIPGRNYKSIIQNGFKAKDPKTNMPFYFLDFEILNEQILSSNDAKTTISEMNDVLWEMFYLSLNEEYFKGLT